MNSTYQATLQANMQTTINAETSPALLSVKQVAVMLGCSPRQVYRLADAGKMPRPIKLGALVRWIRSTLDTWIFDGCKSVKA